MHRILLWIACFALVSRVPAAEFRAGAAREDITPEFPVRLNGYVARKTESEGVRLHIFVKALAISQGQNETALMMTVDNCAVSQALHDEIAARVAREHSIPPERLVIFTSHTHSAPALAGAIPNMFAMDLPAEEQEHIDQYTREFVEKAVKVCSEAIANLEPARLYWARGRVGFAKNRRTPGGPVDHDLPVLFVKSRSGELKAVLANYACHCTTLQGDHNFVHGDWAGVAQQEIQNANPGAIGMISIGCGADSNPSPRGQFEHVQAHGKEVADEVQHLLQGPLTELTNRIEFRAKPIEIPFDPLPTREEWERRAKEPAIVGYHARKNLARLDRGEKLPTTLPYLVQSWNFGKQLEMVFLAGEVVVDYALRLKKEFDASRLWVSGYANFVPCYIPSVRILREGGYEAQDSLWYYDHPARLSTNIESMIVGTVHQLVPADYKATRDAAEFPAPRSAKESLAAIRTEPDLEVELAAAEPYIVDPVAIDWAEDGRLWVVEMRDFPMGMDGNWKPGGRVKVLEDADGDGVYDRATVFLDHVPFPTGITCWNGGALICAAPDILFARDTDGDGKADQVTKLFSGFATENFQARVNSLSPGLDNWFYGANGLIGGRITGGKLSSPVNISNRDFRFHPESGEFETASGLTQQGRVRDDFGNWFGCDNSTLIWQYPLPEQDLRRNPNFAPPATRVSLASGNDPNQLHPISRTLERFNEPNSANRTTSACGLGLYRDDFLGLEFEGNAFICEPVHNLVRRMTLQPNGVTFKALKPASERNEFLASEDNWFRPVQVRTGPDGALWVVDMYRFVVEHPRWITPDRLKALDVRAGADKGRIYRVYPKGKKPAKIRDLRAMTAVELARALDNANGTERDRVQLALLQSKGRDDAAVSAALRELMNAEHRGAVWVQALSALDGVGKLEARDVLAAMDAPDERVRAFAVSLTPKFGTSTEIEKKAIVSSASPSARVRLQAALALGQFYSAESTRALAKILQSDSDRWIRSAAMSSVTGRALEVTELIQPPQPELLQPLIKTALANDPNESARILQLIGGGNGDLELWQIQALEQIARAAEANQSAISPADAKRLRALIERCGQIASDSSAAKELRVAAIRVLSQSGNRREIPLLLSILSSSGDGALSKAAAEALVARGASKPVFSGWERLSPSARRAFISAALHRADLVAPLLEQLYRSGSLAELSLPERQQLAKNSDSEIRALAAKYFPASNHDSRAEVVKRYEGIDPKSGDALHGSELFAANCATCHYYRGQGFAVGPNLAALTDRSTAFLLTSILNPNAAVENRYLAYTAETKDGRSAFGIISEENAAALTVVNANGARETVLRGDISAIRPSNLSLMPEGLEQALAPRDMADLIAFLQFTPPAFGSATSETAAEALAEFQKRATPFQILFASERLSYRGWLGTLPMHHCRQTDGKGRVEWESRGNRIEGEYRVFEFPVALGLVSQPQGTFELSVSGRAPVRFNATTADQSWANEDGSVRIAYIVMQKGPEDSCGIFRVSVRNDAPLDAPVHFQVRGSASASQRWFGLYELPPGASARK